MKKLFTLGLGLILTLAILAAERRPDVTITSMKKYEVVVDGRSYITYGRVLNLEDLRSGRHTIQVYETNHRSSFFKRKKLVASSSFQLRRTDVNIMIDRFGNISIREDRFGRNDRDRDWNDRDRDWNDRDGRRGY
jgi:hypothetical protein